MFRSDIRREMIYRVLILAFDIIDLSYSQYEICEGMRSEAAKKAGLKEILIKIDNMTDRAHCVMCQYDKKD
jgi:hypothetical protein